MSYTYFDLDVASRIGSTIQSDVTDRNLVWNRSDGTLDVLRGSGSAAQATGIFNVVAGVGSDPPTIPVAKLRGDYQDTAGIFNILDFQGRNTATAPITGGYVLSGISSVVTDADNQSTGPSNASNVFNMQLTLNQSSHVADAYKVYEMIRLGLPAFAPSSGSGTLVARGINFQGNSWGAIFTGTYTGTASLYMFDLTNAPLLATLGVGGTLNYSFIRHAAVSPLGSGITALFIEDNSTLDSRWSGDQRLRGNTKSYFFGSSDSARIGYDGTNLIVDPKVAGSGYIDANGGAAKIFNLGIFGSNPSSGTVVLGSGSSSTISRVLLFSITYTGTAGSVVPFSVSSTYQGSSTSPNVFNQFLATHDANTNGNFMSRGVFSQASLAEPQSNSIAGQVYGIQASIGITGAGTQTNATINTIGIYCPVIPTLTLGSGASQVFAAAWFQDDVVIDSNKSLVFEAAVTNPGLANATFTKGDVNLTYVSADAALYMTVNAVVVWKNHATATVFNENGADLDLRLEGDADANLLFLDAGNDRVGVGTNTPAFKLDINGMVNTPGTTGNTYRWNAGTTAPGTTATPVFTDYYGGNTIACGDPDIWVLINVNGTEYKVPGYAV